MDAGNPRGSAGVALRQQDFRKVHQDDQPHFHGQSQRGRPPQRHLPDHFRGHQEEIHRGAEHGGVQAERIGRPELGQVLQARGVHFRLVPLRRPVVLVPVEAERALLRVLGERLRRIRPVRRPSRSGGLVTQDAGSGRRVVCGHRRPPGEGRGVLPREHRGPAVRRDREGQVQPGQVQDADLPAPHDRLDGLWLGI